jgi:hypothetical protein
VKEESPVQWEYRTVKFDVSGFWAPKVDSNKIDGELNQLGRQGWELVAALDTAWSQGASREIVAFFKRRIES